jgi:hypothetical protein
LKDYAMHPFTSTLSLMALALAASAQTASAATEHHSTPTARNAPAKGFVPMASKKGGAGVDLAYRLDGTPAVGKPLTVHIQMFSPMDAQATLQAGEGLQLIAPEQVMHTLAGVRSEHTATVVPQAEGRFYLSVFSSARGRSSASAIAVQVGKGAVQLKSAGKVQVMPSGERIISVPAQ